MTTKLSLFNGALRILKERKLASLTENREPRRLLDEVWGDGQTEGVVKFCLQMSEWTFATRTVQIDSSPSVETPFGYPYAFDQPDDMVRVCGMWTDEACTNPLLRYTDERHYWFTEYTTIYASFVSARGDYGGDMSLWPETFVNLVQARLAVEIAGNLTSSFNLIELSERAWKEAKLEARSIDAMNKPTKFAPPGAWGLARHGNSNRRSRWDRAG